jgi:hypothetical protein
MLRLFLYCFCVCIALTSEIHSFSVCSTEEMEAHKMRCKKAMVENPLNYRDKTYQMERALRTISGDDADYIPKVPGAGCIFHDEKIGSYQLMHNGVKVVLHSYYNSQWLTDVIYGLKGHHEPQEEKCFYEILKYMPENATMIELGSYWAYYSLWFSSEVKGARNYMIEPDPIRLETSRKNFALNGKNGVFRRGFVGIMIDTEPDMKGIEWISIDDFIEKEGLQHVNIIHADIQGAETEMLATTVKHLDQIDYFVISTHLPDRAHFPCLKFFKEHGFIILAEHTAYESCSGDGLIVAMRNGVKGPREIPIRKYPQN